MEIRAFKTGDTEETAQVIAETLRVSNSRDHPEQYIEIIIASHSAEELIKASKERHMYVACEGDRIIGTGGIAGFRGSLTESILLTIFVLPEYQRKGVGRKLIETHEQDKKTCPLTLAQRMTKSIVSALLIQPCCCIVLLTVRQQACINEVDAVVRLASWQNLLPYAARWLADRSNTF